MKDGLFFEKLDGGHARCCLCPHNCIILEGKRGSCNVRKNYNGLIYSENYGKISSLHFDPVEKKPLYHFFPGSIIFSLGSVGCNLHCRFCQNSEISQTTVDNYPYLTDYEPEEIIRKALSEPDNIGIAYTYNEPVTGYEYMFDVARLAHQHKLKNVMVTNGYINPEPLRMIMPCIDAFSIDLKGFTNEFYTDVLSGTLEPVKKTLKLISKEKKLLEITNLIIPQLNDEKKSFEEMIRWISNDLGADTVLHISRYFPRYKMTYESTPVPVLLSLYEIAKKHLHYVYLGNIAVGKGQNTYCKECGKEMIVRNGYSVQMTGMDESGKCRQCGHQIISSAYLNNNK